MIKSKKYFFIIGLFSIFFGITEGSIALAGFGIDSIIEFTAGTLVLWRFSKQTRHNKVINDKKERLATFVIGLLFILLALSVVITSFYNIAHKNMPDTTLPGIIISFLSLITMFFVWWAKQKVGKKLGSSTVLTDATCTLTCIKLSLVLFIGSIIFIIQPALWWIDSTASIILAYFIYKEGRFTLKNAKNEKTAFNYSTTD